MPAMQPVMQIVERPLGSSGRRSSTRSSSEIVSRSLSEYWQTRRPRRGRYVSRWSSGRKECKQPKVQNRWEKGR